MHVNVHVVVHVRELRSQECTCTFTEIKSRDQLLEISNLYFGRIMGINITGAGDTLTSIRQEYSKACPDDHIRYIVV